tara:strand:+ start:4259 stop:5113 length:855 start_codon:yes stop_codon:yes gene_type:complete
MATKKIPFASSTLENIDTAFLRYINETLDIHTTTNQGFIKVPVIWSSAERTFQSKRDSRVRDQEGSLVLPLITIERTAVTKDVNRKGSVQAALMPVNDEKGGVIQVARRIKQDKTSNFANADAKRTRGQLNFPRPNKKVVYETISMPLPVYVVLNYEITLRTEYQQQMNDMSTPFIARPGGVNYFIVENDIHRYEAFIKESYSQSNNINSYTNEERKFETKINVEVLGYILGEGDNDNQPFLSIRENAVDIKIPRERVITRDEIEEANRDNAFFAGLSGILDDE